MEGIPMKIVVFDGSPRLHGNTEIMCSAFAEEAEKQHHTVKIFHVARMSMKGCQGCRYCFSHDGKCVFDDDMTQIYEELKTADMVVFASPIYWFDITAQLKAVIDRMYAFGSTGFHFHKTALLLDSASDHVFDAAIAQYKAMTAYLKWEDQGIITIYGMEEKGSMAACPRLEEVRELARNIG